MDEFFARNRLSAYLDGELPATEAREVEAAIARSPDLRAELDALRAAIALLRDGGPVPAPPGFARRLDLRLAGEPLRVGWRARLGGLRPEVVLLAAAAAMVLVYAGRGYEQAPAEPEAVADAALEPTDAPEPPADAEAPAAPELDAAAIPVEAAADRVAEAAGAAPGSRLGIVPSSESAVAAALGRRSTSRKAPAGSASMTISGSSGGVEREAYVPDWEKQEKPVSAPTVYAPPRYRLQLTAETGLMDLDQLVRQYGGRLEDERGRPLAPYPMEMGDSRKVQLRIPAGTVSAGQLYERLQALGHAELTQTETLYATSSAPVVIEVTRE